VTMSDATTVFDYTPSRVVDVLYQLVEEIERRVNEVDVDFASVRHPKEIKSQSPYRGSWGRSYVFGKTNEAFSLRAGTGYQKELFSKFDQGGISVRFIGGGGLSLALLKPVYYQKITGYNPETMELIREQSLFDPDYMQSVYDIYDRESFFIGIDKPGFVPGVFARAGICFEYSSEDNSVRALEGGVQMEGFLKKLPILSIEDNQQLFLTLYITYRFGKVIDARFQK